MNIEKWDTEKIQDFYDFLQGEIPKGFHLKNPPKLDKETAFTIIYVLQEEFHTIPDSYEVCENCGKIYDSWNEGARIYCKNYCGWCDQYFYPDDPDWEYGDCKGCLEEHTCPFNNEVGNLVFFSNIFSLDNTMEVKP